MKPKHLKIEKDFYDEAYQDPATRLERGYGWGTTPSPSMVALFEKHVKRIYYGNVLDIGIGADGRNAKYFLEKNIPLLGIDISENALRNCCETIGGYPRFYLENLDFTLPTALLDSHLKLDLAFSLVIDWSVMDHIRRAYLPAYKDNILSCLRYGGYLISSQFADPLPEKFKVPKGKDFCLWGKHYMRCFTIEKLIAEFPALKVIDYMENCPEDDVNGIKIHSVLFQKVA
ncbi:MAG: class I SAM-dependent methyltransferase [Parcubacteria group bacterium]|jgi:SAM-dependent methyltransferase